MSKKPKSLLFRNPLVFTCENPIPYGTQIAFLGEAKKIVDKWVTTAQVASELYEIHLNNNVSLEKNFVILRCQKSAERWFSHYAVSVEQLEKNSQEVENNITSLLQSI